MTWQTLRHPQRLAVAFIAGTVTAWAVLASLTPAADTVEELAKGAVFTFNLVSDNHSNSPFTNLPFARMDQWQKELGDEFIVGVGDHVISLDDPFIPFMHADAFWHSRFYPNPGDHDNECYGTGEDDWGAGGAIFNEVDLASRPWVQIRPNGCEYYAQIPVGDWTVHLIAVHYPDQPQIPSIAFPEDSRQYMIDTLNSIQRGPKDIVIVGAHSDSGYWVPLLSAERQQVVMEKADLVLAASTHFYERYIHPTYGDTGGALCLNTGQITSGQPHGYTECFVFDNPPRLVTIHYDCQAESSPQLRTGQVGHSVRWTTYWAYEKKLGQVSNSVSWMTSHDDYDAYPAGASSPEGTFQPGWNLISIPLDPIDPDASSVFADLCSGANSLENNLFRYQPGAGYQIYPSQFTEVEAGRAYWLSLEEAADVDTLLGTSRPDQTVVPLSQGWNMIGIPRTWPVTLSNCKVKQGPGGWPVSWFAATTMGWVDGTLYYYDGSYKTVRTDGGDDDHLRPWTGYWILVNEPDLYFVVPPGEEPTPVVKIYDVTVEDITPTTATVRWTSAVHATSRVDYGTTADYTETTGTDPTLTRTHSMTLLGLPPGTEFHFQVTSTADGYDPGVSDDATFTTASSATLPADAGFESGTLDEWVPWPGSDPLLQVGGFSALGQIYPHSGSYFAYSKYASSDTRGGLYARVAATPGTIYEASAWSNLYMMKNTEPFPPDEDCRNRIGIDPAGGRDPYSPSVIWSDWDQRPNKTPQEWRRLSVQAEAQGPIITVFLEFDQHYEEGYHQMVNAFDDVAVTETAP